VPFSATFGGPWEITKHRLPLLLRMAVPPNLRLAPPRDRNEPNAWLTRRFALPGGSSALAAHQEVRPPEGFVGCGGLPSAVGDGSTLEQFPGKNARTKPISITWSEFHNLSWIIILDQEMMTDWHLTTWTELTNEASATLRERVEGRAGEQVKGTGGRRCAREWSWISRTLGLIRAGCSA
jgi:hypothetical protein